MTISTFGNVQNVGIKTVFQVQISLKLRTRLMIKTIISVSLNFTFNMNKIDETFLLLRSTTIMCTNNKIL